MVCQEEAEQQEEEEERCLTERVVEARSVPREPASVDNQLRVGMSMDRPPQVGMSMGNQHHLGMSVVVGNDPRSRKVRRHRCRMPLGGGRMPARWGMHLDFRYRQWFPFIPSILGRLCGMMLMGREMRRETECRRSRGDGRKGG